MACLSALVGCSTSSSTAGHVQELGDGIYSVGVRNATLGDETKALKEAVDAAGKYCHARGQKLQIVPDSGDDVRFRCTGSAEPSSVEPAKAQTTH
jgi:hypothetical protein